MNEWVDDDDDDDAEEQRLTTSWRCGAVDWSTCSNEMNKMKKMKGKIMLSVCLSVCLSRKCAGHIYCFYCVMRKRKREAGALSLFLLFILIYLLLVVELLEVLYKPLHHLWCKSSTERVDNVATLGVKKMMRGMERNWEDMTEQQDEFK